MVLVVPLTCLPFSSAEEDVVEVAARYYQRTLDSKNDVADAFEEIFKVPRRELEE